MPRFLLTLEYAGEGLIGWQKQAEGVSVQGLLEGAASRLNGGETQVTGAGRTDAGVHATAQAAHVDISRDIAPDRLRMALNYHLQEFPVCVTAVRVVAEDFHARFSAVGRHYLYRILNRSARPALDRGRVWHVPEPLDVTRMRAGRDFLLGTHDFSSFRDSECQAKSPVKTLDRLEIEQLGDELRFTISARSFLHHQVRNMVGTLRLVGGGKWEPENVKRALEAKNRIAAGPTAPAYGLYLTGVDYEGFSTAG